MFLSLGFYLGIKGAALTHLFRAALLDRAGGVPMILS